jgi:DNA polymerase III sliding clamp (beta) subunit (PCNA family)
MKVVTDKPDGWKAVLGAISTLNEEAILTFKEDGISFGAMDQSKVSYIGLLWEKSKFSTYDVPEETKIGVRVPDFMKLIKRSTKESITITKPDESSITILIGDRLEYILPLIPASTIEKEVPTLKHEVSFKIDPQELDTTIKDINVISTFFDIESDGDTILLKANDDNTLKVKKLIPVDKTGKGKSSYSLVEMIPACEQLIKFTESVKVGFTTGQPLELDFVIPEIGTIIYLLAPKME